MSRRPLKAWEIVAVLLRQLRVQPIDPDTGNDCGSWGCFGQREDVRPIVICPRTRAEITPENVKRIQIEHWPIAHKDGGETSVDNCIISLAEGHAVHTKRERKQSAKERRLRVARLAKAEVEKKLSKPKWRLKKKLDGSVVKVRTR